MNIEMSESKYWRKLNYDDGILYCQLLDIDGVGDWRMIKDKPEFTRLKDEIDTMSIYEDGFNIVQSNSWLMEDGNLKSLNHSKPCWVIPVRGS